MGMCVSSGREIKLEKDGTMMEKSSCFIYLDQKLTKKMLSK